MPFCKKCGVLFKKNGRRTTLCDKCWLKSKRVVVGNLNSKTNINKEKKKIRDQLADIKLEDMK